MSPSRGGKVRGDCLLSRGVVEILPVTTDYGRVRASIGDRGGLCVTLPKLRHCDWSNGLGAVVYSRAFLNIIFLSCRIPYH